MEISKHPICYKTQARILSSLKPWWVCEVCIDKNQAFPSHCLICRNVNLSPRMPSHSISSSKTNATFAAGELKWPEMRPATSRIQVLMGVLQSFRYAYLKKACATCRHINQANDIGFLLGTEKLLRKWDWGWTVGFIRLLLFSNQNCIILRKTLPVWARRIIIFTSNNLTVQRNSPHMKTIEVFTGISMLVYHSNYEASKTVAMKKIMSTLMIKLDCEIKCDFSVF